LAGHIFALDEVITLGPFTFRIPVSLSTSNWREHWTKQLDKTAFQLTAQHQVSDGGGLLGAVVSSSVAGSLRRRLPGRWDAIWSAGYANNSSLDTTSSRGAYQSLTAGAGLARSLTEKLSVRVGYDYIRQLSTGQSQLFGDFGRDLWSIQFSYRFHEIALRTVTTMEDTFETSPVRWQDYWGDGGTATLVVDGPLFVCGFVAFGVAHFWPVAVSLRSPDLVEQQKVPETLRHAQCGDRSPGSFAKHDSADSSRTRLQKLIEQSNLYPDQRQRNEQ